jgi:hypothetical protein
MLAGESFPSSSLATWLSRYPDEVRWLDSFGAANGPDTSILQEDSWRLYALSRVLQLLLLSFQTGTSDGSDWGGPGVSAPDVCSFARDLGLSEFVPEEFAAIDCEIVTATQAPAPGDPARISDVHWPGFRLGDLIVCRSGVSIRAGTTVANARVATSSTLYWAYRRKNRPYQDLSHGWGGNSQWRTSFRRDYKSGSHLFYNVDGEYDLSIPDLRGPNDILTHAERIELLTNRCFILTEKPHDDHWPYDDRLVVST